MADDLKHRCTRELSCEFEYMHMEYFKNQLKFCQTLTTYL